MPKWNQLCVLIFLLSCNMQTIKALKFDMKMLYKCAESWDISNSNLYNVAYAWTKHRELKSWDYNILKNNQTLSDNKNCISIKYNTEVAVPRFFEDYMPSVFNQFASIHISKIVCEKQNLLTEEITMRGVPIINELSMNVKGYINQRSKKVDFNVYSNIEYPWYLILIKSHIEDHIKKSLQEYMNFLTCQSAVQQKKVANFVKLTRKRRMIPRLHMQMPKKNR